MRGKLSERVAAAKRVVVLTGAGVSAESGVPTFRGADGLWRQYRAEVNLEPTPLTALAHASHRGKAADLLPRLLGLVPSPIPHPPTPA